MTSASLTSFNQFLVLRNAVVAPRFLHGNIWCFRKVLCNCRFNDIRAGRYVVESHFLREDQRLEMTEAQGADEFDGSQRDTNESPGT